ncbi:MAG TPA: hypothetical protein VLD55_11530 [Candidatus Sulfobium mesophilum]|nr:hypothetical protein [Candidatus Sulfobium mesophilum]
MACNNASDYTLNTFICHPYICMRVVERSPWSYLDEAVPKPRCLQRLYDRDKPLLSLSMPGGRDVLQKYVIINKSDLVHKKNMH